MNTKETIERFYKENKKMKGVYVFKSYDDKSFKIGCSKNIVKRITDHDYFTSHLNIGIFYIWYTDDEEVEDVELDE